MNEVREKPVPDPVVPPLLFWMAISVPPSMIYCASLTVRVMLKEIEGQLVLAILIVLFMFLVIAVCLALFHHAAGKRYRGVSLEYLCAAFFLGQAIVCTAVWLCFFLPLLRF